MPEDGYLAEWRALADVLSGTSVVEYDELLDDARYALTLADAAAALILEGAGDDRRAVRTAGAATVRRSPSFRCALAGRRPRRRDRRGARRRRVGAMRLARPRQPGALAVVVADPTFAPAADVRRLAAAARTSPVIVERPLLRPDVAGGRRGRSIDEGCGAPRAARRRRRRSRPLDTRSSPATRSAGSRVLAGERLDARRRRWRAGSPRDERRDAPRALDRRDAPTRRRVDPCAGARRGDHRGRGRRARARVITATGAAAADRARPDSSRPSGSRCGVHSTRWRRETGRDDLARARRRHASSSNGCWHRTRA